MIAGGGGEGLKFTSNGRKERGLGFYNGNFNNNGGNARTEACNVIIAQSRRISAASVVEKVAAERGENLGG